uniref:Uncharacterized protein n=1 Tax=Catagonus wagneri TaxID=51154 RepID=A0A8C3WP83_9CETA
MEKVKKALSQQDTEDRGNLSKVVEATSFSSGTRIKDFIACFAAGILCSLLGTLLHGQLSRLGKAWQVEAGGPCCK